MAVHQDHHTNSLGVQCYPGQEFTCEGVPCCHHEHQPITWGTLVDVGSETGYKFKSVTKKYFYYKTYTCEDHDDNSETPNTCAWPFPTSSQDGPSNNPTHYVYDNEIEGC